MYNSPWMRGSSDYIPIYSGQDGCLDHWVSWNRGVYESRYKKLPAPTSVPGDDARDITPGNE